jgi:hypothetical protein
LFLNSITLFCTIIGGYVVPNEDKKLLLRCGNGREIVEGTSINVFNPYIHCMELGNILYSMHAFHASKSDLE